MDNFEKYKTDCYWFAEETTMGGHIRICRKSGCECECKECKIYLSISEADKIIERNENVKEGGCWITSHPVDVAKEFKCTACGGLIELPVFAKRCYYDYCPNCGARMDLKDGDSE